MTDGTMLLQLKENENEAAGTSGEAI